MPGLFSCCKGNHKKLRKESQEPRNNETIDNSKSVVIPEILAEEYNDHLKSYHSEDSYQDDYLVGEDEESMRGVSNVVYRKEYVQSVYSFTSEQLGVGATGPIRTVINRETKQKFAMKTINMVGLSDQQKERLIQEVLILGRLHHPNIVKLYEVYETESAIYLIMELLSGGELYTRLIDSPLGRFSEEYSRGIIREILNAITYLHETKNIAHRDLKLANIMFADCSPDATVKLIDFGLSKYVFLHFNKIINDTDYMHSLVGTRYYMAPEVFSNDPDSSGYGKSCDMWSLGVISYFLLTGHNPLPPQMADAPLTFVKIDHIPFPPKYWNELSKESKDFVEQLLQVDPSKRLTALKAQRHPWFNSMTVEHPTMISPEIVNAIQEYQEYNHLKKAALTAVAYHLNNNDLMKLSDAFEFFDKRGDGMISFEEFRDALLTLRNHETLNNSSSYNITTDETKLRELFNNIDFGENGYINYSEFVGACLARKDGLRHEYAELIFDLIDREHVGHISVEDLHLFFGDEISINEIEAVVKQTFGCVKESLTKQDLEMIMNTKMIVNNNTEALAMYHSQSEGVNPDETYISVSSIFSKAYIEPMDGNSTTISVHSYESVHDDELMERSKAVNIADRLANISFRSNMSQS